MMRQNFAAATASRCEMLSGDTSIDTTNECIVRTAILSCQLSRENVHL